MHEAENVALDSVPARRDARDDEGRAAFRDVFARLFPRLRSYFRAWGFSAADAEDLSQEALFNVYRAWDQYRGEGNLDAWVYAAARNLACDSWRRKSRARDEEAVSELVPDLQPAPDDAAAGRESLARTVDALAALPAGMRACLLMQVQEGLSHKEIARRLALSPHTVKAQIRNARQRLKSRVEGAP